MVIDPRVYRSYSVRQVWPFIFVDAPVEAQELVVRLSDIGVVHIFNRKRWPGWAGDKGVVFHGKASSVAVYGRAKIALAWTMQGVLEALACEAFVLARYFPGLEVFTNGRHLVWHETLDEAVSLAEQYLASGSNRKGIARRGRQEVLNRYATDRTIQPGP